MNIWLIVGIVLYLIIAMIFVGITTKETDGQPGEDPLFLLVKLMPAMFWPITLLYFAVKGLMEIGEKIKARLVK